MACVKHYSLYGAAEAGRDYSLVDMSRARMYNEYLPLVQSRCGRRRRLASWPHSTK